jgi:hypothetical protein
LRPSLGDRFYRCLISHWRACGSFPKAHRYIKVLTDASSCVRFFSSRISCRWFRLRQGYGVARRRSFSQ